MNKKKLAIECLTITVLTVVSCSIISVYRGHQNFDVGMLDTKLIVAEHAKQLAENHKGGPLSDQQLRQITDRIKEQVGEWCKDHQVILLSKGAVWGGQVKDYTQMILRDLELMGDSE